MDFLCDTDEGSSALSAQLDNAAGIWAGAAACAAGGSSCGSMGLYGYSWGDFHRPEDSDRLIDGERAGC